MILVTSGPYLEEVRSQQTTVSHRQQLQNELLLAFNSFNSKCLTTQQNIICHVPGIAISTLPVFHLFLMIQDILNIFIEESAHILGNFVTEPLYMGQINLKSTLSY